MYEVHLFTTSGEYVYLSDSFPDFESARLWRIDWLIMAGVK